MANWFKYILCISIILSACTTPRKYQKNKPFVFKNTIDLDGGNFSGDERKSLKQKLSTLLDDSMKLNIKDYAFLLHKIKSPPAYDSNYAAISARNMKNTLLHLGYYQARDTFKADTARLKVLTYHFPFKFKIEKQERVSVKYTIDAGNPTLIDTISYRLQRPELQQLAIQTMPESFLLKGTPVTKGNVLAEISRLVELFRNNGYYKFSSDDLKLRGDTTIASLTNISDDPFENIRLLAEANKKRDKPTIKLAMVLNPAADSLRLKKYYINNIYIWPDFTQEDAGGIAPFTQDTAQDYIIRYHKNIVKNSFLVQSMFIKKGDMYRQEDYAKTVNNFSKIGVWQNVNIQIVEPKDSLGKIDMIVQLIPSKKFGFEANIEASYSANSNSNNVTVANAGNLLGLSGNLSLQNRNVWKQGIKWTHAIRAGVELNLNARPNTENFINSSEVGYNGTVAVPKLPQWGYKIIMADEKKLFSKQTIYNASISNTNRIGLFKLNSVGGAWGFEWSPRQNRTKSLKINGEYSNLYNRSYVFDSTLRANPYLRYSFNTALVMGLSYRYSSSHIKKNKITNFKWNLEESGFLPFPLKSITFLKKDLKEFIKTDIEVVHTINHSKSAVAFRLFVGVGAPIGSSDTTLPFFKQYFGGGPNSMRAWPIRGIGPGSKQLAPYGVQSLNDRTGDMRFELNAEYRRDLFQIIPNTLILKWALFADIGNVWNYKNTNPNGAYDSTKFEFKNFYKQLGVNLGTGFRLDFNYVLLRFDLGFRFKRPELDKNDGWKAPSIGFDDLFKKIFTAGPNDEYRKWRYENFNFSIGLTYPF